MASHPEYAEQLHRHYAMMKEAGKDFTFELAPPDLPIRREIKIGRNEPCSCGSGKKYKKCCLLENK